MSNSGRIRFKAPASAECRVRRDLRAPQAGRAWSAAPAYRGAIGTGSPPRSTTAAIAGFTAAAQNASSKEPTKTASYTKASSGRRVRRISVARIGQRAADCALTQQHLEVGPVTLTLAEAGRKDLRDLIDRRLVIRVPIAGPFAIRARQNCIGDTPCKRSRTGGIVPRDTLFERAQQARARIRVELLQRRHCGKSVLDSSARTVSLRPAPCQRGELAPLVGTRRVHEKELVNPSDLRSHDAFLTKVSNRRGSLALDVCAAERGEPDREKNERVNLDAYRSSRRGRRWMHRGPRVFFGSSAV